MEIGLYYYNARYYAPTLARFISADTLVPDPTNPQTFNRYSYVENRPLNFNDPTGHIACKTLGTEQCDESGNFVDAPPTPDEIRANWNGKKPLPGTEDEVDVTLWLYEHMIGNASSVEAQLLKELWVIKMCNHPVESLAYKSLALLGFREPIVSI